MIAEGYKDTEIGVIPVEWDVVKLQDYIKLTSGKFNPKKNLQDKKNDSFKYPVYGGNGITGFFTDYLVSNPTIVIGRVGEYCGSVYLEKNSIWITDNAIYTKEISPKFNIDFLYEIFAFIGLENLAERTGQPKITQEPIYNLKIPLLPLKEQERIADILSTADDKIDAIQIQIDRAKTLKKGLLQKLLSEGIGHSKFKDSEIGVIPADWKMTQLKDVVYTDRKITYGIVQPGENIAPNGIPLIRGKDYSSGKVISDDLYYVSEKIDAPYKRSKLIENDLLMTIVGYVGQLAIVPKSLVGANITQTTARISVNKDLYSFKYIYQYLKSYAGQKSLKKFEKGSAQPGLNLADVDKVRIPLPPLEEQEKIADILSTADEKLEVLRTKKKKYETLKKGLMQKLLSGEVRVKVA